MSTEISPETQRTLRPIVTLLYVNLGISVVLGVLTFLFKNPILDYQIVHIAKVSPANPAAAASARDALNSVLWIRPASVLLISIIYVRLAARLKLGKRRTYIRLLAIAIAGFLGLVYLIVSAQFPVWMQIGQAIQGLVLIALFCVLIQKNVRSHFSTKKASPQRPVAA